MAFTTELIHILKDVAGENHVFTKESIGLDYTHDELAGGMSFKPDAVVEVRSADEVSAVLRICSEAGVPVTVRGAGTGKAGGSVPVRGGVILSLKGMNKIIGFNEGESTLTVQPGVLLQDVKAEAARHGLFYPPDPGEQTATIGGNASTNAAGPSAVKYGTTKDYIADAELVFADGSVARLSDKPEYTAVPGSEGALAVITELTLRLISKPASDAILLLPFLDSASCVNAARRIIDTGINPAAAEYLDTDMVEYAGSVTGNPVFPVMMDGERVGATLMLTIEGDDEDAVMEQIEMLADMAEELECLDILVGDTPTMKRDFWAAHDAFHTSTESAVCSGELNIDVPPEHIAALVDYAKALGQEKGIKVMAYAHVGSGGVHIHAVADMPREEFTGSMAGLTAAVYARCAELGGDIIGEYGVGYAKTAAFRALEPEKYAQFAANKASFDPRGILNPGKVME